MWQLPTGTFELAPGEVHLWRAISVPTALDLAWHGALLTPAEMARATRLATETLRRRYLQAHSLLHTLLNAYMPAGSQRCDIAYHPSGKPYLAAPQLQPQLEFNMSHASELVVIALARGDAVGVDVEFIRPLNDLDAMITATCTQREQSYLTTLAADARLSAFYWLWTRKEAWLKLLGIGLGRALTSVEVHNSPLDVTLLDAPLTGITGKDYTGKEYIGTVAVNAKHRPNLRLFDAQWK